MRLNIKNLFKKKTVRKIVISFTENESGGFTTRIAMDGKIPVIDAQDAINRTAANVTYGLKERIKSANIKTGNGAIRKLYASLTIADIIKTKTLKY
jgi:hypothetical protein